MLLPALAGQHRRLLLAACRRMMSSASLSPASPVAGTASIRRPLLLSQPAVRLSGDHHGPRKMLIQGTRYYWEHFWDDMHYYFMLGAVPCGLLAIYLYIFVGPAELTEIPEGYEPMEHEYQRHPLTRALAWLKTHAINSEQETYEKRAASLTEEYLRTETRKEFRQIKQQEALLGDYRGYYFVPVNPRGVSQHHMHRHLADRTGDNAYGFQGDDPREAPKTMEEARHQF